MSEYLPIFAAHIQKLVDLRRKEREIRSEIEKVVEMVKVSFTLMSGDEQAKFTDQFQAALNELVKQDVGLTDAIRILLESNPTEWFDAIKVRERLNQSGFDFSGYTSNPLASIHTVLKRFRRKEVKVRKNDIGMNEYRYAKKSSRNVLDRYRRFGPLANLADLVPSFNLDEKK